MEYKKLLDNVVSNTSAEQAAFYIVEYKEQLEEYVFKLKACVNYAHEKLWRYIVPADEAVLGKAYREECAVSLEAIPRHYVHITGGHAFNDPRSLVVVPVHYDGSIVALIELTTYDRFSSVEVNKVAQLAYTSDLLSKAIS